MKNLVDDSVVTCYEIIDTAETIWNISNNKKVNIKWAITVSTLFISNHLVIDNSYNLLLLHKTSVKTKRHIAILIMQKWRVIIN